MNDKEKTAHPGLPWPDAYRDILPAMREQWGVSEEIYLSRQLSGGKSGALVYSADVNSSQFTGLAILKLDQASDSAGKEEHEADLHRQAIVDAPDYAEQHLPKLIHSLHHGDQLALLSTIAGRGLEYAEPWSDCSFERQLAVVRCMSKGLLEEWNQDYTLTSGIHMPQRLISDWLGYRIDPAMGGRIHDFLQEKCGISPDEPSVIFEGHWYPNPLAFALGHGEFPERLRLRAATGHSHGDLHGLNLLVSGTSSREPDYFLIDLAMYRSEQFLFGDHAYFEMATLLTSRGGADAVDWESILRHLSRFRSSDEQAGLRADDLGLVELVGALREEATTWIDRHEGDRLSYMESQYLLARVAAGLNFTNKQISEEWRRMAFIYAASNLKDYMKLNRLDWPKHGPGFTLTAGAMPARNTALASTGNGSGQAGSEISPAPVAAASYNAATSDVSAQTQEPGRSWLGNLLYELRRRHVVKVAGVYIVAAWLCIQVAGALKSSLNLPDWTDTLVTVLLLLGFPIACIFAWAFETSPDGLKLTTPASEQSARRAPRSGIVDYVAAFGIIAILAFTVGDHVLDHFEEETSVAAHHDSRTAIAVLPFKNLSAGQENDDFSDGLTVEIMNTLAQTGKFRIAGRSSTFKYKNQPTDLRQIGSALGVKYILDGSVRRSGDDIRVEAQLIESDDGFLIWSHVYNDQLKDIFVVQQEMANSIGTALKMPLGLVASDLQSDRTPNPEAYDSYLRGIAAFQRRGNHIKDAIEMLRKSVEIEPEFAAGWAALSLAYDLAPVYVCCDKGQRISSATYFRQARAAALKAAALDPNLPIVKSAVGNMYRRLRQWTLAEDQYRGALEADPNDHTAMKDYAVFLALVGHFSQAISMVSSLRQEDPLIPLYEVLQAIFVWQIEQSELTMQKVKRLFEEYPEFRRTALRTLVGFMFRTNRKEELKQLVADCDSCSAKLKERVLGMIEAVDKKTPDEIFEEYKDDFFVGYSFFYAIGGKELALKAFQYNGLREDIPQQLVVFPWSVVSVIGREPEFKDITRQMGLVDYWRSRGWPTHCRPLEGNDFECS